MAETGEKPPEDKPLLEEMAHWTGVIGQIQQQLMEHGASAALKMADDANAAMAAAPKDPQAFFQAQTEWWREATALWRKMLPLTAEDAAKANKDRKLSGAQWQEPLFDVIRQTYVAVSEQLLGGVEAMAGVDPRQKEQLRFAAKSFVEAMSPANFALTNPQVIDKIVATRGANLVTGLERMLADSKAGQIRHVGEKAFEIGKTLAMTPGKVIHETPLYQLIHYAPVTESVQTTPLIIFPPWINRFYILDLTPQKSFVKWGDRAGLERLPRLMEVGRRVDGRHDDGRLHPPGRA